MSEVTQSIMSEHEPVGQDDAGKDASYQPDKETRKTIRLVQSIFDKNKKHKKKYDGKWLENYKMFRGKQWKENRPTYRHSEVINLIFQAIQTVVPIMTDARPKVEFVPKEPSDNELAEILNQVFESDWEQGNWLQQLTEIIYDAHFYSVGFACLKYDPEANMGAGAITFESDDPFYQFPDPNARDCNIKCQNWITAEPTDVSVLKREFPEFAKYIKPDLVDIGGDRTNLEQIRYRSPVDARILVEGDDQADAGTSDEALKITLYLKSDEYMEEAKEEANSETGQMEKVYEQKLKYPNGRKIVLAGGVLVHDGPNPYEDGKMPYARLVNYILPREFYGISEIEQLESPQKTFNKLVSFALDVMTLMGNPVWIIDSDAGVDTDNLFNRPGLIIEKNKGSEVRREEGVQLQPYVIQMITMMGEAFNQLSGSQEVSRGARPEGITAASAIAELQDAAQTRIRLKSRNLDACLRDIGALWLSRAFQFYTAPKVFRITRNENAQQYFKMSVSPVVDPMTGQADPMMKSVSYAPAAVDPMTGAPTGAFADSKVYQTRAEFDVRVTTGSSLPFAKTQKVQLATTLFDRGAIDQLELLKAADYPNYEAVWQRVQQAKMQEQQAAMAAQAQGAKPNQPVA